jgi:hypothetical protein
MADPFESPDTMGEATRAAEDAVVAAGRAVGPLDPNDLMTRALIAATLAPGVDLLTQTLPNGDGTFRQQYVPMHRPSPMAEIGRALWEDRKREIIAAVVAQVTPETVAAPIAIRVTEELTRRKGNWDYRFGELHPEAQAVQRLVHEQLAKHLSAEALTAWEDEQREMRAALAEKRSRDAAATQDEADGRDAAGPAAY